jgi:tetratricopeptide (TPR) repeat protein
VPTGRLRELVEILDAGRPDLKSVLSWHENGALPGSHYPVGWALVEFSFHYEDDAGDHPYLDSWRAFLDSWRNGDDRRDALTRFVDCYVERPKRAGVATLDEFGRLWSRSMRELAARTFGGAEQADAWRALAQRQIAQRRFNGAAESLRNALDHRPGDPALLIDLAACELERGDRDGAMLAARHALASAGDALRASALALLARADKRLADECIAIDDRLRESALASAQVYADAGLPRCALRRLDEAAPLLLDDAALQPLREELSKSGVAPGRWRRLAVDAAAAEREPPEPAATRYVVEALIEPRAPDGEVADGTGDASAAAAAGDAYGGVLFGESERDGARLFAVSERRRLALHCARSAWDGTEEFTTTGGDGPLRLSVEVELAHDGRSGRITCRLDGAVVRSVPLDVADFLPRVGVRAAGAAVRIRDARWRQ